MQPATPDQLDRAFAALADPTRRAMLVRLAREGVSVGELGRPFRLSKPAITKHVRVLERAGFVHRSADARDGRVSRLRADAAALKRVRDWLAWHQRFWNDRVDALEEHLARPRA